MRVYVGDGPYDTSLSNCCGVSEFGGYINNGLDNWQCEEEYPKIKDLPQQGCGVWVSTFLGSDWRAYKEMCRYHTCLFRSKPYKNLGPDASRQGREKGVYVCVFKHGKETNK
jgi:hypothetical protein